MIGAGTFAGFTGMGHKPAHSTADGGAMSQVTEARVARVFAALLEVRAVGADDDLFQLGGDSFVATQIALELERIFDVPIPIDVMEAISTVRGIAAWIDERRGVLQGSGNPAEPNP